MIINKFIHKFRIRKTLCFMYRWVWRNDDEWRHWHGGTLRLHPLFRLRAMSIFVLMPDAMHILDLGVSHHALGNVLFVLIMLPGYLTSATAAGRCDELWGKIVGQYAMRGTPSQLQNLDISFFCDPSAPHKKPPVLTTRVKAAETRLLPCNVK